MNNVIPFRPRPTPYIAAVRAGMPRSEAAKLRYERRTGKPQPPRSA